MGKKAYGIIVALFILVSIGMGIVSYFSAVKIQKVVSQLDKFQWVIPLGSDYTGFNGDANSSYFIGNDKNNYNEVAFDENGHVVVTGHSFFWVENSTFLKKMDYRD